MPKKIIHLFKTIWGYFPLSLKGIFLSSTLGLLWYYEVLKENDFILLIVCVGFAILLGLALLQLGLAVILFFAGRPSLASQQIHGQVGKAFLTGYKIKRLFLTPSLEYTLHWESNAPLEVNLHTQWNAAHEQIKALRRIDASQVKRKLEIQDSLGLVKFRHFWTSRQQVLVESRRIPVSALTTLELMAAGDELSHPEGAPLGDLLEVRQYQHGVPLNRILWKVYGRNRKLMVRMPETALARQQKNHVYFVTNPQDEPVAELLLSLFLAGSWGRDFVFATDGAFVPTGDTQEATRQILASSNAEDSANNLEAFLQHSAEVFQSHCVIMVPACEGPWLEKIEQIAQRSQQGLTVMMVAPELGWARRPGELQKILMNDREDSKLSLEAIRQLAQRLRRRGVEIKLLDLKTGNFGSV